MFQKIVQIFSQDLTMPSTLHYILFFIILWRIRGLVVMTIIIYKYPTCIYVLPDYSTKIPSYYIWPYLSNQSALSNNRIFK